MATAKTHTVQVWMKYEEVDGKIQFTPARLHLKQGDVVEFLCEQGTLDLIFDPADAYEPPTFRSGNPPVYVSRSAKGTIWCGGTFQISDPAYGPTPKVVTIDPKNHEYGSSNDPGPIDGNGGGGQ